MSFVKKIPVNGNLHGHRIFTTVDNESARYYIEDYLAKKANETPLAERIDALKRTVKHSVPARDSLRQIAREFSVDFAALFFADIVLAQPNNAAIQRTYLENLKKVHEGRQVFPKKDILIMLVPGYDYKENGKVTGADLNRPRQLLQRAGYDVAFVDIDPIGSVEENAQYLLWQIKQHPRRQILVAGPSSAGPAIHLVLGSPENRRDIRNVKAWLNMGGVLQGVPVLDRFSSGPKGWLFSTIIWFKGWKKHSFESMYAKVSRERFQRLSVPQHVQIYNFLGLSLSGNISRFAADKYMMMREDGPNDGLTLLADSIAPNSLTIFSPHSDHFFAEDPEIDAKTQALLLTIVGRLP